MIILSICDSIYQNNAQYYNNPARFSAMILNSDYSETVRYNFSDYPIHIQRSLLSAYPQYSAPSHWHEDIELIAVLSGRMQYNINGEIIILNQGEGVVVNARQMHFGFSDFEEECEFLCALLHPLLLCVTPAYERDFVLPLLRQPSFSFVLLHHDISWQRDIYTQIKEMYEVRKEKTAQMKIQTAFMAIWSILYENTPLERKSSGRQDGDLVIVKSMIGFIQKNYKSRLSLADIAASGAVGQSKCCKLFSKYLGQTPNGYLTQYRLSRSMILLKNTDKTVTEIAVETGFGSGSYYAEIFRRQIGKTPTEYRDENSRNDAS